MGCDSEGSFRDWKDAENEARAEQVEEAEILDKALNDAAEEGRDREQDKEIVTLIENSDGFPDRHPDVCLTPTCHLPLAHPGWHEDEIGYFEVDPPVDRKPVNDKPTGTGEFDAVARPKHYNAQVPPTDKHPDGIECIDVIMWFDLARGNAMKYLWRAGEKGDLIEDLDKAIAFIEFAKYKEQQRRKHHGEVQG